jgi:hypothetical protein
MATSAVVRLVEVRYWRELKVKRTITWRAIGRANPCAQVRKAARDVTRRLWVRIIIHLMPDLDETRARRST